MYFEHRVGEKVYKGENTLTRFGRWYNLYRFIYRSYSLDHRIRHHLAEMNLDIENIESRLRLYFTYIKHIQNSSYIRPHYGTWYASSTFGVNDCVGCWGSDIYIDGANSRIVCGIGRIEGPSVGRVFGHNSNSSRFTFYDSSNVASGTGTVSVQGQLPEDFKGHYWVYICIDQTGDVGNSRYHIELSPYWCNVATAWDQIMWYWVNWSQSSSSANQDVNKYPLSICTYGKIMWGTLSVWDSQLSKNVMAFYRDTQMVTTEFSRLCRLPNETPFQTRSMRAISEDIMWCATDSGVFRVEFDRQTNTYSVQKFTTADGLQTNNCTAVVIDNEGKIWIGTASGLHLYNSNTNTFVQKTTDNINFNSMVCSTDGIIWYTTPNSLVKYIIATEERFVYNTSSNPALPTSNIQTQGRSLDIDSENNLWICFGSGGNGVCFFDTTLNTITNYTVTNGLPHSNIYALFVDKWDRPVLISWGTSFPVNMFNLCVLSAGQWITQSLFPSTGDYVIGCTHGGYTYDGTYFLQGWATHYWTTRDRPDPYSFRVKTPIVKYTWTGSQWKPAVRQPVQSRPTHSTEEEILFGLRVKFEQGSYVATDFYNFAVSSGIVKDNLQEIYCHRETFMTELITVRNETTIAQLENFPLQYPLTEENDQEYSVLDQVGGDIEYQFDTSGLTFKSELPQGFDGAWKFIHVYFNTILRDDFSVVFRTRAVSANNDYNDCGLYLWSITPNGVRHAVICRTYNLVRFVTHFNSTNYATYDMSPDELIRVRRQSGALYFDRYVSGNWVTIRVINSSDFSNDKCMWVSLTGGRAYPNRIFEYNFSDIQINSASVCKAVLPTAWNDPDVLGLYSVDSVLVNGTPATLDPSLSTQNSYTFMNSVIMNEPNFRGSSLNKFIFLSPDCAGKQITVTYRYLRR